MRDRSVVPLARIISSRTVGFPWRTRMASRRPKITFIGAGSVVFARALLRDLFTFPELHEIEIALMDIDPQRLADIEIVAKRVAEKAGASPGITATLDRRAALNGADYVINMIQVGGYQPSTVIDFEVPKRFGLRQTIGDTL